MKFVYLALLFLLSCSAQKEIVKIKETQIKVEGKEYALSDLDFDYDLEEPILVIDTLMTETASPKSSETKVKVKIQVRKKEKKADIEVVTLPTYITSVDTTTTVVLKPEAKSEFKFWAYWILGVLVLIVILLFVWKAK